MFSTWHGFWYFKDLTRRTASGKMLRDKAFNITKNPKYDEYQPGFASLVYKCFDKNPLHSQISMLLVGVLKVRIFQRKN